jgi:hypothetical protein
MRESYGELLQQGLNKPWMRMLLNVLGYTRFEVYPNKVVMKWRRTGFSFEPGYPLDFENDLPPRDWRESWFGRVYETQSAYEVVVSEPPRDVDGVYTVQGAEIGAPFEVPGGTDYYVQPVPVRPEEYTTPSVPLDGFPESLAVVDYVPETVYTVTWYRVDLDDDGDVDLGDFATFALYYGFQEGEPMPGGEASVFARCDLDGDGDVDLADFATFALDFTG